MEHRLVGRVSIMAPESSCEPIRGLVVGMADGLADARVGTPIRAGEQVDIYFDEHRLTAEARVERCSGERCLLRIETVVDADRRVSTRFRPRRPEVALIEVDGRQIEAPVIDRSSHGIAVVTDQRLEVGCRATLAIRFHSGRVSTRVGATVVRWSPRNGARAIAFRIDRLNALAA